MSNLNVEDLFMMAEKDIKLCLTLEAFLPDEDFVSAIAYHMQQAVEKILKALIIMYGENPEYTHNIAKLCRHLSMVGGIVSEDLEDIADTLTLWESESRYDPYLVFSINKYNKAKIVYYTLKEDLEKQMSQVNEIIIENDSEDDLQNHNSDYPSLE